MKQFIRVALLLGMISFSAGSFLHAGKPFEGVITFKITYPDNKFSESQMAMFPKVFTITVKGTKARTDMQMSMGNQSVIIDYEAKNRISMMNMMGQKYAIQETAEDIEKELANQPKPTVQYSDETKTIAGYTCKKAIVTVDEDGQKTNYEVWYTTEIESINTNFDDPVYRDIKGVLMEFSMSTPQDFSMKFTATSVEKKSVSAKEFEIPAEFVPITKEELKTKFGGGM
jgi:hypothetical protein